MKRAPGRKVWLAVAAVLCLAALLAWFFSWDPEKRLIEQAAREYVGDLKTFAIESASHRIFPDDLFELKNAALFNAGIKDSFRAEALAFFEAKDLEELRKAPKERFFQFLLNRTYKQHRHLFDSLALGKVVGVRVKRKGTEAEAAVFVDVARPEGKRRLTVRTYLINRDGTWWIRI